MSHGPVKFTIGYEHLGGSAGVGDKFTTPLATLHKFNGWADKFLATPDAGLVDRYIGVKAKLGPVSCAAIIHDFSADAGSGEFGTELDLEASYPVSKQVKVGVKFAQFEADASSTLTDTDKLWFWLSITP